jgi:hypothetical protein
LAILQNKKRESGFLCLLPLYGCFLIINSARTAPIMMMTIMIAMIPYSSVVLFTRPVAGVAAGVAVAAGELA